MSLKGQKTTSNYKSFTVPKNSLPTIKTVILKQTVLKKKKTSKIKNKAK